MSRTRNISGDQTQESQDEIANSQSCCCGQDAQEPRYKATPRTQQTRRDIESRLNRVIGQLNGVKLMLDDNRYCGDVLTQLAAAEKAVRRISDMVLQEHMKTCVVEQIRAGNDEVVDEVITLMKRFS